MIRFNVFVRTSSCRYAYSAIHKCAADAVSTRSTCSARALFP